MNILTIDFDIIMSPTILFYNKEIYMSLDVSNLEANPLVQLTYSDNQLFSKLTELLLKINEKSKIKIINSHEEIIKFFSGPSILTNIDFHHDCGYNFESKQPNTSQGCGNWVHWLRMHELLHDCVWMGAPNSDQRDCEPYVTYNNIYDVIDSLDFNVYDEIILCKSFAWIPTHIRPLFNIWEQVANN